MFTNLYSQWGSGGQPNEFLSYPVTSRGLALGGAYSTFVDDASALFYNPARLTNNPTLNFTASCNYLYYDTKHGFIGGAWNAWDNVFVGTGLVYLISDNFVSYDRKGYKHDKFSMDEYAGIFGIGYYNNKYQISIGASYKNLYKQYYNLPIKRKHGFDIGITKDFDTETFLFNTSLVYKNIHNTHNIGMGIGTELFHPPIFTFLSPLKLLAEYMHNLNKSYNIFLGAETTINKYLDLRIGFDFKSNTLRTGIGFNIDKLGNSALDMAFGNRAITEHEINLTSVFNYNKHINSSGNFLRDVYECHNRKVKINQHKKELPYLAEYRLKDKKKYIQLLINMAECRYNDYLKNEKNKKILSKAQKEYKACLDSLVSLNTELGLDTTIIAPYQFIHMLHIFSKNDSSNYTEFSKYCDLIKRYTQKDSGLTQFEIDLYKAIYYESLYVSGTKDPDRDSYKCKADSLYIEASNSIQNNQRHYYAVLYRAEFLRSLGDAPCPKDSSQTCIEKAIKLNEQIIDTGAMILKYTPHGIFKVDENIVDDAYYYLTECYIKTDKTKARLTRKKLEYLYPNFKIVQSKK